MSFLVTKPLEIALMEHRQKTGRFLGDHSVSVSLRERIINVAGNHI